MTKEIEAVYEQGMIRPPATVRVARGGTTRSDCYHSRTI